MIRCVRLWTGGLLEFGAELVGAAFTRRVARRFAWRLDGGFRRDQRTAEMFSRRTDRERLAAEAQGDHPVLRDIAD